MHLTIIIFHCHHYHYYYCIYIYWLVVSTPLKKISQWEGLSHILWKNKIHVWNHQPVYYHITFSTVLRRSVNDPLLCRSAHCRTYMIIVYIYNLVYIYIYKILYIYIYIILYMIFPVYITTYFGASPRSSFGSRGEFRSLQGAQGRVSPR